ncbi:helix-turn-helix domain-containing protein [Sphingomonas molluscorum]|uniref:helix-turn-helix domain-containing protein n=1 Tax=Sphingomonas TaxID=13687 RepID=UPI003CC87062
MRRACSSNQNIYIPDIRKSHLALPVHSEPRSITRSIATAEHFLVADLLKNRRREAGLTQNQVAQALGRPQSFVAEVEAGQRRIDMVELLNLARAIGFDPKAFFSEFVDVCASRQ